MHSTHRGRGSGEARLLVFAALLLQHGEIGAQAAETPTASFVSRDSNPDSRPAIAYGDSNLAVTIGDSGLAIAPGDSSTATAPSDSSVEISSRGAADSSRIDDLTFVADSLTDAEPAEDAQGLSDRLQRLTAAASKLPPDERLVFDEVVAAAREMLASGDLEASRLLTADAIDVLRRGSP